MTFTSVLNHVRAHWKLYAGVLALIIVVASVRSIRNAYEDASITRSEAAASKAEGEAFKHEGSADAAKAQADALEPQRIELERQINEAKRLNAAARANLAQSRKGYDEAQTGRAVIDRSGTLDERERRVGAKLDQLYPGINFGAGAIDH